MRRKTMTELRRALRLAQRADRIKRAHGQVCNAAMTRLSQAHLRLRFAIDVDLMHTGVSRGHGQQDQVTHGQGRSR